MQDPQEIDLHNRPTDIIAAVDLADDGGMVPPLQPWYRRPGILALIAGLVIIALVATLVINRRGDQNTPVTYQFATLASGTLNVTVNATGPLQSGLYNLTFVGSGKIASIDVNVGQQVKAGQELAKLDPTSLQDAVNQAQSGVNSAQASLNSSAVSLQNAQTSVTSAQTSLDNANTNLANVQAQTQAQLAQAYDAEQTAILNCNKVLTPTPTIAPTPTFPPTPTLPPVAGAPPTATPAPTATPLPTSTPGPTPTVAPYCVQTAQDTYNAAVASANAQINNAQGQINSAQVALKSAQGQANSAQASYNSTQASYNSAQVSLATAQHNLANATLVAPHDGVITQINGSVGGTPGSGTGGAGFIQIADLSTLQVLVNVNEADIGGVAAGQTATFTVSAYKNRTFTGKVSTIAPLGTSTQNVVTYPVTVDIDTTRLQGANLLPGMTGNVTIITQSRPNVVLLPINAVSFARAAAPVGSLKLLDCTTTVNAATAAIQDLRTQEQNNAKLSLDSPQASYVVEQDANKKFIAKAVVLGLTDGQRYAVVDGLQAGEVVVVGRTGGTSTTTSVANTSPLIPGGVGGGGGRGGAGGAGGFGGGTSTGRGGTSTGTGGSSTGTGGTSTGRGGAGGGFTGGNLSAALCGTSGGTSAGGGRGAATPTP